MKDPVDTSRSPIDPETLKALSTLTLNVRKVVEGLQGGSHASMHFGASVEFAEHKRYHPGDDIRHLDWSALARTDRYFVKQHQREVILNCLMVLDCSASMAYRGQRALNDKLGYAVQLLAAMAHILVRQGDAAGLLTFASKPEHYIPPGRRPDQLSAMMQLFATVKALDNKGTGFSEAVARVAEQVDRRSMIVLATDLWGAGREAEVSFARLAARGHDVIVFYVLDPDESDLPFDYPCVFRGTEGEPEIEVDPALIREDFRREAKAVEQHWQRIFGKAGIDFITSPTSVAPAQILAYLAGRRHRKRGRV
jgi:uncharacterized protein (DUF58 family)